MLKRICGKCKILSASPLDRNAVMNLRVCDLKWFLKSKSVSIFSCTEKSELVDLVMQHATNVASSSSYRYDRDALEQRLSNKPSQTTTAAHAAASSHANSQQSENSTQGNRNSTSCPTSPRATSLHTTSESCSSLNNQGSNETATSSLDDLKGPDHIAQLSIRQLKLILVRNFVDYKGCCEKLELQDRVLRLWRQKQERESISMMDENVCKICWESQIDCVMLECGHMATCTPCGKQMNECPICRQYVVRVVHTFKA